MSDEKRQDKPYLINADIQQKGTKDNLVSIRSKEGERIAYTTLGDKALRLYLLITSNKDGVQMILSSNGLYIGTTTQDLPKMCRKTFTNAIKELKDNGFLVKNPNVKDGWIFKDKPEEVEPINITLEKDTSDDLYNF